MCLLVAGAFFWFAIPYFYNNYTGYCPAEARYLPDSELIDLALVRIAKFVKQLENDASLQTASNYRTRNPDCCRISDEFADNAVVRTLLGGGNRTVEIVFEPTDKERAGRPGRYAKASLEIGSCGWLHPHERYRGSHLSDKPFFSKVSNTPVPEAR